LSKTTPDPTAFMNWVLIGWGTLCGAGALVFPWRKLAAAQSLVKEYDSMKARAALDEVLETPEQLSQEHPLSALADRVRQLADGNERVLGILDVLVSRLDALDSDAQSLRSAMAVETELGAADGDPRMSRMAEVLARNEATQGRLNDALRDLHVELTVRADQNHEALFSRLDDLLLDFSVDTELSVPQTPEADQGDRLTELRDRADASPSEAQVQPVETAD